MVDEPRGRKCGEVSKSAYSHRRRSCAGTDAGGVNAGGRHVEVTRDIESRLPYVKFKLRENAETWRKARDVKSIEF